MNISALFGLEGLNEADRKAMIRVYYIRGIVGLLGLGAGAYIAYLRKGTGWNYLGWMLLTGGVSGTVASLATLPTISKISSSTNVIPAPGRTGATGLATPSFLTGSCNCTNRAGDISERIPSNGMNCNEVCVKAGYAKVKA